MQERGGPQQPQQGMTGADRDLASWMLMSGDLLGYSGGASGIIPPAFEESLFADDAFGHPTVPQVQGATIASAPQPLPQDQTMKTRRKAKAAQTPGAQFPQIQMGTGGISPLQSPLATDFQSNSGQKRKNQGSSVASDEGLDQKAKRQRRLEKNREIARNCRRRKREKYQKLEEEVEHLRKWTKQLESQLNEGKDSAAKEEARKKEMQKMHKAIEGKHNENQMRQVLTQYKEMYSDFGRERKSAITYHMGKLKSLLLPNTVSKMTLWSLQQNDEFYDEKKNQKTFGGGIWNILCSELELTEQQKKNLMGLRGGIRQQRANIAECLRILRELDSRVNVNFDSMTKQMEEVMESITPEQQIKFLLWIERNKAATFMINNMFQANDSEQGSNAGTDDDIGGDSASTLNGISDEDDDGEGSEEAKPAEQQGTKRTRSRSKSQK